MLFRFSSNRLKNLMILSVGCLMLASCGKFFWQKREEWRDEIEAKCMKSGLVEMSAYVKQTNRINGPGVCGMNFPLKVSAALKGSVGVTPAATLACQMIPNIDRWMHNTIQPAAQKWYGAYVVEMKAGSYACRSQNNQRGAKLSEHSYGNALDVFGFVLSDGRTVSVLKGWNGDNQDQVFLREVFTGGCDYFTTVIGPGGDAFHHDHFHIDLAKHDAGWEKRICRPRPETLAQPLIIKP
jgi:hypothetical protein